MRLAVLAAARRLAAVARAAVSRLRRRCRRPWALGVRWCKPPHDGCHPWSLTSTSFCFVNRPPLASSTHSLPTEVLRCGSFAVAGDVEAPTPWVARGAERDASPSFFSYLYKPQTTNCAWRFRGELAPSRPVFSQALWRALLPCLSSFVPTYLGSLLVEPTFPLCDNLVTTERHCTRAPLSRQRRMSTLALCASARAARQHAERGESFFLPPTHTDAGILLRGIVGRSSADSIGFGLTFVC